MMPISPLVGAALLLCLLSLGLPVRGQQVQQQRQPQQTQTFQPTIGQPGKDVVWVPTPQALVDKMLDMAKVTSQDYVIDLGSGDGRTVITAAKRGARALGIEYNPDMVDLSKRNAAVEGVSARATFVKADIFQSDFSQATVITMFLFPTVNLELRPKILAMKPGTRVVSNTFTMDDWAPDEKATIEPCEEWCTALFWVVPAKVGGSWRISQKQELKLTQHFQVVSGTLGASPVTGGKLRGDELSFVAGGARYTGRVDAGTIRGTVTVGGRSSEWVATRGAF